MLVKKSSLLLLFALAALSLGAQKSERYLKKMPQEGFALYFIVPTSFAAQPPAKLKLEMDFTFQYSGTVPEEAEVRFSVFSRSAAGRLEGLSFFVGREPLGSTATPELLFLKKEKRRWHSRFSATLPYASLQGLLQAGPRARVQLTGLDTPVLLRPQKSWIKAAEIVHEILAAELE
jgi:hypothetical protein